MFRKNLIVSLLMIFVVTLATSCGKNDKTETTKKPATEVKQKIKQEVKSTTSVQPTSTVPGSIGSKAAEVTTTNLAGESVKLSDYKGKVVMLNFWATWCGPCRQEIPDFIKMYDKHESDGLVILGIGGFREDASKIEPFVADQGINYPVAVLDPNDIQKTSDNYGQIKGIPTTFLIDKDGIIREKWVGPRSEEVFMAEVNKYLK